MSCNGIESLGDDGASEVSSPYEIQTLIQTIKCLYWTILGQPYILLCGEDWSFINTENAVTPERDVRRRHCIEVSDRIVCLLNRRNRGVRILGELRAR